MTTIQPDSKRRKPHYPAQIQVGYGGEEGEVAFRDRVGLNGALYKTEGCHFYLMTTDGHVMPLLY